MKTSVKKTSTGKPDEVHPATLQIGKATWNIEPASSVVVYAGNDAPDEDVAVCADFIVVDHKSRRITLSGDFDYMFLGVVVRNLLREGGAA